MGKTSNWLKIKNFLSGRKDREKDKQKSVNNQNSSTPTENPTTPISTTSKEKRRWSFRTPSAVATASKESNSKDQSNGDASVAVQSAADAENEQRKHAMAMVAATAAAADIAVAAAEAAAAVIRLASGSNGNARSIEEAAAIKIQSIFRSYLARKALCALRGLVKLQALARGHLVRKQATAALRCMQALVTAQARARAHRIRASESKPNQRQSTHKKSRQDDFFSHIYDEMDRGMAENIKIVDMDVCGLKPNSRSRNNLLNQTQRERSEHRFSTYSSSSNIYSKEESCKASPAPSALTEYSPRPSSSHFEEGAFSTAQSSPQSHSAMSYDYPLYPNYMANTESSRAKARSQSVPKQRPETFERQLSRRRASIEGRNVPKPVRMQRSSSLVGVNSQKYQVPWSIKLDGSTVSLIDSECGSTSTVLTNTYCKSHAA